MNPTLKNVTNFRVIKVARDTKAHDALALMEKMQIRHLPVIDESGGKVVGILSDRDLLRSPHPDRTVQELMSNPILTFDIKTPLVYVAQAMVEQKVSCFLITSEDEIEGIVTSEDLLLALIDLLKEQPSAKWLIADFLLNSSSQRNVALT